MKSKAKPNLTIGLQKYFAEFLGVFFLTSSVTFTSNIFSPSFTMATPLAAALTLMLFVYTVGHISGAHLNPAVTFGMWLTKNISAKDAIVYVLAQVAAAMAALIFFASITGYTGPTGWAISQASLVCEIVGAFILVFGVANVANKNVPADLSGVVVGGSLLLGITFASVFGAGVINPAIALAYGSISIPYLFGPLIGGLLAAFVYRILNYKKA